MSDIDTDELDDLQSDLPEETIEEFNELQEKDDLTEEEEERLEEIEDEVAEEDANMFETLSRDTYNGIKQAAKYGVEPDQSDVQRALSEHADEINEDYGGMTEDDAQQFIQDNVIEPMIERSTDFTSFAIGVKALGETLGEAGNSEN